MCDSDGTPPGDATEAPGMTDADREQSGVHRRRRRLPPPRAVQESRSLKRSSNPCVSRPSSPSSSHAWRCSPRSVPGAGAEDTPKAFLDELYSAYVGPNRNGLMVESDEVLARYLSPERDRAHGQDVCGVEKGRRGAGARRRSLRRRAGMGHQELRHHGRPGRATTRRSATCASRITTKRSRSPSTSSA